MKVIASVQSKRGSSRGLVHYIAHSKIDTTRESEKGREIFNAFSDKLDVKSANNFLKSDCGKGRPSNDELHHLVLSFRPEDFQMLGPNDEDRKRRLKSVTRFAISQLEKNLESDRLTWAAVIHLNTTNPHVHLAIQKHYLTRDLQSRSLNKIPRSALPHFETVEGQKQIVQGILIEAAKTKLDELIAERGLSREKINEKKIPQNSNRLALSDPPSDDERQVLRFGILAEYRLKFKEEKIAFLIEHRDEIKFPVSSSTAGLKPRTSIRDLRSSPEGFESDRVAEYRQIKAISLNILAKEEAEFFKLNEESSEVRINAQQIRKNHKADGTKLPLPAFTKEELDELQGECLTGTHLREFQFLEQIRISLESSQEIQPRNSSDLRHLTAHAFLSELRLKQQEKRIQDFKDEAFYRKVLVGDERVSLAMIDRESRSKASPRETVLESMQKVIESLSGKNSSSQIKALKSNLSDEVKLKLHEQLSDMNSNLLKDKRMVGILGDVLKRNHADVSLKHNYSVKEVLEIDTLARKLRTGDEYTANWAFQKKLLGEIRGHQRDSELESVSRESNYVARRIIARKILCEIDLNQARDAVKYFRQGKRFHKFAVEANNGRSTSYLSLNDVDLPRKKSFLDQTLDLLLEDKTHRELRREITNRVNEHQGKLKNDLVSAKELMVDVSREASELSMSSFWSRSNDTKIAPLFTEKEILEIEKRITTKAGSKEAAKLRSILERSTTDNSNTYDQILQLALTSRTSFNPVRDYGSKPTPGNQNGDVPINEKEREIGFEKVR